MQFRPLLIFLALLRGSASFVIPSSFPIAKDGITNVRAYSNRHHLRSRSHDDDDVEVTDSIVDDQSNTLLPRRSFWRRSLSTLAGAYTLSTISPISTSYAAEITTPKMETYNDIDYGFHLSIPSSWENTEQKLSGRRKALFFTDPTSKDADSGTIETFGFVAYTPVRDDFTSLASFGSVENVAQMTILPKGDLAGQNDDSKMVSAISKNNAYYFDYIATPVVPIAAGESSSSGALTKKLKPQHFRTIFTLLPLKNSAGMTLVTITLQTSEERYGTVRGLFDNIIDSFGKN
ncbi:hypothetical protein ACHAXH_005107 [Discostella pseudostelligera]|jgi:hypothetical protein